jgi:hypothetical protein
MTRTTTTSIIIIPEFCVTELTTPHIISLPKNNSGGHNEKPIGRAATITPLQHLLVTLNEFSRVDSSKC